MSRTAYLAPIGLEDALKEELGSDTVQYGRLFLCESKKESCWAQNIWLNPQVISFQSINEAARQLRALHSLWSYHPYQAIRRGHLIQAELPYFSPKPMVFGSRLPEAPLGAWTLLDEHTLLASPQCSSRFADGEVPFIESRIPPSRAYLKLWELFTLIGKMPQSGEKCLELGASPGSWTWVLQQLGAHVTAVDRAPLSETIQKLPNIVFTKGDAFSMQPKGFDWVFSDVICYPEKLLEWIRKYEHLPIHFVCTIKFQGNADHQIMHEFAAIEGSKLMHLSHNKHELTWTRLFSS